MGRNRSVRDAVHSVSGWALKVMIGVLIAGLVTFTLWQAWSDDPAFGAVVTAIWISVGLLVVWLWTMDDCDG